MRWLSTISYSVKALFTTRKLDEQLSEEIRAHVELATEANVAQGMTPEEARCAALREFGNVTGFQEQAREARGGVWLDTLGKDLKFALRRLVRTPAFTLTALTTLALCVGANTAIFAVVDALILRPLPFPEPARLMAVVNSYPGVGNPHAGPSIPNYFERRESIKAFAQLGLFQPLTADVGGPGDPRKVPFVPWQQDPAE